VAACASASSRASVSGVAIRVSARTLAYDTSPRPRAAAISGSSPTARATRTRSRAAPGSSPTFHPSHAAQEGKPLAQPCLASNSRISWSNRAVAASRWADSSAISSPSRWRSAGGQGAGCRNPSGVGISMANLLC
jgi:hypothetical protein